MDIPNSNLLWHKPVSLSKVSPKTQANAKGSVAGTSDQKTGALESGSKTDGNSKVAKEEAKASGFGSIGEEFESLFMSMMIKEMRNTLDSEHGGLFQGDSTDTLGGMFDMFMSQHMSQGQSLGIGEALNRYTQYSLDNPDLDRAPETQTLNSPKEATDANSGSNSLEDRIPIDIPPTTRIETFG